MTSRKRIYVNAYGSHVQMEIGSGDSLDDVMELFRTAVEAGPRDLIKVYSSAGKLIKISPDIKPNTAEYPYEIVIVGVPYTSPLLTHAFGIDFGKVEEKLEKLERLIYQTDELKMVRELKDTLDDMTTALLQTERLRWLGFSETKDLVEMDYIPPGKEPPTVPSKKEKQEEERCEKVFKKFRYYGEIYMSNEVRDLLKRPTFDNWQWEDHELICLIKQMLVDLELNVSFHLEKSVVNAWLCEIYRNYRAVPFHNFKHCFMVTQMTYALIWILELQEMLSDNDLLILLISAICHDIDHPGLNNAFQVNLYTKYAVRYNDFSPLESHHCATAFAILCKPECNILRNLSSEHFGRLRDSIIQCILGTDMSRHSDLQKSFKAIIPVFDVKEKTHKDLFLSVIVKVSDISNEARPMDVAMPWLDALFEEFTNQFRLEREKGVASAPFMDLEKVNKPTAQVGFIKFVLLPLYQTLADLFPVVVRDLLVPVKRAFDYWSKMEHDLVVEKQRKEIEIHKLTATRSKIMINVVRSR